MDRRHPGGGPAAPDPHRRGGRPPHGPDPRAHARPTVAPRLPDGLALAVPPRSSRGGSIACSRSSWSVRPVRRRLLALATLLLLLASHAAGRGRHAPRGAARPRVAHPGPDVRDGRRRPPVRARLPRRLGPRLRCDPSHLRRGRRRLAGHVQRPGRQLAVQGRPQRRLGRELRPPRAARRQHPAATCGADAAVKFYYDHKTHWITDNVNVGDRGRRPAASSPSSAAPATGSPTASAPGSRTPTATASTRSRRPRCRPATTRRKVALNESWDVNYGQGGVQGGANIAFTVPATTRKVTFSYDASTHVLTITSRAGHGTTTTSSGTACATTPRDTLYRTPGGAVPAGTPGHAPLPHLPRRRDRREGRASTASTAAAQEIVPMSLAATGVSCYQAGLAGETCDFWQATLPAELRPPTTCGTASSSPTAPTPTTTPTTPPRSTAASARATDDPVDHSWALMLYEPGFTAPAWAKDAVIYQIFPDRFRNGQPGQRPADRRRPLRRPGDQARLGRQRPRATAATTPTPRHELPVALRHDAARRQPDQGAAARPRLLRRRPQGRRPGARLPARPSASTAIYFNPIFDAGSNHGYDTQDYPKIDPYFGTQKDCDEPGQARQGPRDPDHPRRRVQPPVVRQPVLRPLPPLRDRRAPASRPARRTAPGSSSTTCRPGHRHLRRRRAAPTSATYDGWFGFDSIPVHRQVRSQHVGPAVLPDRLRTRSPSTGCKRRRVRLAPRRHRRRLVPERLLGDRSARSSRRPTRRADISETWQKDSTLLRDAPRRPARHDDELPPPRRGARPPRARGLRREGLRRQRPRDRPVRLPRPAGLDPRGLPGRRLLLADEPARQPRHRAPPLDAHARARDDGRTRRRTRPTSPPASSASGSRR